MTDDWAAEEGEFDERFFASLEADPDAPVDESALDLSLDLSTDDDLSGDDDAFLYEAEGDGSFETEAADPDLTDDDGFGPDFG